MVMEALARLRMKRKLKRSRGRTIMRVARVLGTFDFLFYFFFRKTGHRLTFVLILL